MKLVKIEIIIANSYLELLVKKLEECGIVGYTAIEISRGKGIKHGEHLSEGLLPTTRNTLVFCITVQQICEKVANQLESFFKERGAIFICYEVQKTIGIS